MRFIYTLFAFFLSALQTQASRDSAKEDLFQRDVAYVAAHYTDPHEATVARTKACLKTLGFRHCEPLPWRKVFYLEDQSDLVRLGQILAKGYWTNLRIALDDQSFREAHLQHLANATKVLLMGPHITDTGLSYLRKAQDVFLTDCPHVTDAGLAMLPNANVITLGHCPLVTRAAIEALIARGVQVTF